jgi:lipopolysaccharide transport system ATP-binding protein
MKPIIIAENVSKQYHIGTAEGARKSLREIFGETLRDPLRLFRDLATTPFETIWALKDVSFEVQPGEVFGFIGPNGAGKSTLLKILSRITQPSTGRIQIYGHVGSLLEVGTGFHPELTGRENVFLNGAILGMKREEIARKFDEIVAFSEVDKFIDTPVKYYSSGMYMRLAFSIAAHFEPEVLIVDEVLAVGDSQFQKKCLGKMSEVAKQGRTVLFVSHNMIAVQSLCDRVFWLDHGGIIDRGPAQEVIGNYFKSMGEKTEESEEIWSDPATAPGNDIVRLHRISVGSQDQTASGPLTMKTPVRIDIEYWNREPRTELHITLHLYTEQDIIAFTTGSAPESPWTNLGMPAGLFRSSCYIPGELLNAGRHRLSVYIVQDRSTVIYQYRSLVSFEVIDMEERRGSWFGREPGVVNPYLKWTTEQMDAISGNGNGSAAVQESPAMFK